MTTEEPDPAPLTDSEQTRLDELLRAARAFHHLNCLVAAVAMAIATLGDLERIRIPGVEVTLPRAPAAVALYILSIAFAIVSDRMFRLAYPWLLKDPRRVAFAWYALGYHRVDFATVSLWLLSPVVVTSIAVTVTLPGTFKDMGLLLPGFVLAATPRLLEAHAHRISRRLDHRGGAATLSMWLLYWYRLSRNLLMCLFLALVVIAAVPSVRVQMLWVANLTVIAFLGLLGLRTIGGFAYRRIDRLGGRLGFPTTNVHDYKDDRS